MSFCSGVEPRLQFQLNPDDCLYLSRRNTLCKTYRRAFTPWHSKRWGASCFFRTKTGKGSSLFLLQALRHQAIIITNPLTTTTTKHLQINLNPSIFTLIRLNLLTISNLQLCQPVSQRLQMQNPVAQKTLVRYNFGNKPFQYRNRLPLVIHFLPSVQCNKG